MAEKPTFRERIRSLTAPPTLEGRLWNSLGDGLIAVAAYQFGKYLNNLAGDKLNHAGPLLNQATDMLYSNQHLSSEQLVQVTALHNQVQIIFNQVKVLDFASEVTLLRQFRDSYLEKSFVGKVFINIYYHLSPPIARVISKSKCLRAITKQFLKPFVYLVKIYWRTL